VVIALSLIFSPFLIVNAGFLSIGALSVPAVSGEFLSVGKDNVNSQTVTLLQAAVNIDPNPNVGGGDITVVDKKALLAETGVSGSLVEINEKKSDQINIYEVRVGDTLSQIAEMFDVTVNTIRWANELDGGITPGQTLVILPISGITHTVKSGGTIADIAKIYDADTREIALFNGISVDSPLNKGDKIMVPNASPIVEKSKPKTSDTKKIASGSSSEGYSSWLMRPLKTGVRSQGIHGYNGVDLAAPAGTPIYAAAGGQVIISKFGGWNGGYGNYVVIKHGNGTQTLYAHNTSNTVAVGQTVVQGELIGYVGSTGHSTGDHVHFEVRGATNPF